MKLAHLIFALIIVFFCGCGYTIVKKQNTNTSPMVCRDNIPLSCISQSAEGWLVFFEIKDSPNQILFIPDSNINHRLRLPEQFLAKSREGVVFSELKGDSPHCYREYTDTLKMRPIRNLYYVPVSVDYFVRRLPTSTIMKIDLLDKAKLEITNADWHFYMISPLMGYHQDCNWKYSFPK